MTAERRSVAVCADWDGLGGPTLMGLLHHTFSKGGKEVLSFEYDKTWLDLIRSSHAEKAQSFDPELRLFEGPQYPANQRANFNVFLDSSPDRWGRLLLKRREAQLARQEQRKERTLSDFDFLLGVYDGHRMGALRFRQNDGPFLDANADLASPPWTSLRELEHASRALERDGVESDPAYGKWLQMLIAPGRSLGGQRPKASVRDIDGSLWIAKFPKSDDEVDIGAWENVVHTLALSAGVVTSEARCERFSGRHHTFLTKRFDRTDIGRRRHFSSAMTMLSHTDGDDGVSYLELAEFLIHQGSQTDQDLEQLWRRIVFNVCVSNVDDHLRNHGFMLEPKGWTLAPAYDMNPVASSHGLTLNISENDNAQELDLVQGVAREFRVKAARAASIVRDVVTSVQAWRAVATTQGLSGDEQERMSRAFRVVDGAP